MHSELSSTAVREKLSSTRQLLEQALNKKNKPLENTVIPSDEPTEIPHNQLKKPDFEQLNHIYENYMKVPTKQEDQCKGSSTQRSSSAPPIHQRTKEKLIKENEEKFKQECTFRPTINKTPHGKNKDNTERKLDREEWFKRLTRSRNEIVEHREKQKWTKEEDNSKNCSFRPNINSYRSLSTSQITVDERLYNHNESIKIKREQEKREKDEIEASAYPFSPQITQSVAVLIGTKKTQAPLYQRIYEVQQKKNALRQLEKEKSEKREGVTFQPSINQNSRRIAESKKQGNIMDRLSRTSSQIKDLSETCQTFISASSKPGNTKEFINRQQEHQTKCQKKKEELAKTLIQDLNLTFKPSINKNSNLIAKFKRNYSQETITDKIKRIGPEAQAIKLQLKEQISNEHYEKFTFEPEINNISRQMAGTANLSTYHEELKIKKKIKAEASVAEIQKICSFSPKINPSKRYSMMVSDKTPQANNGKGVPICVAGMQYKDYNAQPIISRYKQSGDILGDIEKARKEKEQVLNAKKQEKEIQISSNCTFRPQGLARMKSECHVEVKGMDRFYELKNIANRQKVEQDEREKKFLYRDLTRDLVYAPKELC
ncbi:hypothetical protein SteCoe_17058 [Stentor coeruleus]|uniref:Uncharacterized protein n=1 Tax=Stentor coeruleus TaxID=5963 RepID=A0A1R2BZY5_9CILI|nr:hypothetical protein SteCoe_17058 [Stentor coeruleus]